jgi:hypothetical protein
MAYATLNDVATKRYGSLAAMPTAEQGKATVLLEEAEAELDFRLPTLAVNLAAGTVKAVLVRKVVTDAVIRVLRNPSAVTAQTLGPESVQWSAANAVGTIAFTDDELALLTPAGASSLVETADGQAIGSATLGRPARPLWLRRTLVGLPASPDESPYDVLSGIGDHDDTRRL